MKRLSLILAAVGALAILGTQANAADRYGYYYNYSARANHNAHHDDLGHRGYHRELDHREAHRYPMSWRGHERLHDNLNHDAYHDQLEHRGAHRSNAYSPYRYNGYRQYNGFGYSGRGFSFRIGY